MLWRCRLFILIAPPPPLTALKIWFLGQFLFFHRRLAIYSARYRSKSLQFTYSSNLSLANCNLVCWLSKDVRLCEGLGLLQAENSLYLILIFSNFFNLFQHVSWGDTFANIFPNSCSLRRIPIVSLRWYNAKIGRNFFLSEKPRRGSNLQYVLNFSALAGELLS